MKLLVKNVAKVKNAEIENAGITTLIGYNSTGKSTVSRSLFSIGEMFSKFDEKVEKEKLLEVSREMERWVDMYRNLLRSYQMQIKDKNFTEYEHNIIGKTLNKYFNNQYCSYYNEEPMQIVITNENDETNSACISMNGDIQYEKTSTEDLSLIYIQPEHILDGISILNLNLNMDKTLNDEIDENQTSTE